jgi:hypothetical protein
LVAGLLKSLTRKLACETAAATSTVNVFRALGEAKRARAIQTAAAHIKLCAIGTRAEVDFSVMPFDDDSVADNQSKSRA